MNSLQVSYVELDNKGDIDVLSGINEDLDWNSFVEQDLTFCHKRNSKDGLAFIPAKFKENTEWVLKGRVPNYRNDDNVESLTMIVLDIDDESGLQKTIDMFGRFENVMYSTFSYSKSESPYKMRMVLPLEVPLSVEQWYETFDQLKHCIDIDPSCRNASRLYYYHSMPSDLDDQPVVNINKGEHLSYDTLKKVIRQFIRNLDADEKASVQSKIAASNKPQHRRHFSGGQRVNIHSQRKKTLIPDFSYEGFVQRHEKLIEQHLSARCFDNFALHATKREIENFGPELNLNALVQFITRASIEFTNSNHVLTPSSDTLNSLPTKITGAMSKFQPEWFAKLGGHAVHGKIMDMVNSARVKAPNKMWDFPKPVDPKIFEAKQSVQTNLLAAPEYSESVMRKRNKEHIMQFASDKSDRAILSLFANVAKAEFEKYPSGSSINMVGEFIFKQLKRYHGKINPEIDINTLLDKDKDILLANSQTISNHIGTKLEGFTASKIETSIKLAHSRAVGKLSWSKEFQDNPTNELAN